MKNFEEKVRRFFEENITGILATIAFHLFLFVVFLVIKISASSSSAEAEIVIDFSEIEEIEKFLKENKEENPNKEGFEELYEEIRQSNLASNMNAKFEEEISTDKYVEYLMDELDIDDLNPETSNDDLLSYEEETEKPTDLQTFKESSTYRGITSIMYNLKDRTGKYLHVPVYKCERGGKVVIDIAVNQKGKVVGASINQAQTEAFMTCLEEAAVNAAYRSSFNMDFNAPLRQTGTITYIFKPQ